MGVLDSSYIKALGVKSAGLKKIFLVFQDTLIQRPAAERGGIGDPSSCMELDFSLCNVKSVSEVSS